MTTLLRSVALDLGYSTILPNHTASSSNLLSAQAEPGRRWNGKNQSQQGISGDFLSCFYYNFKKKLTPSKKVCLCMHQPVPRLDCLPPRRLVLDVAPHLGVLLQRQSGRVHLQGRQGAALHAAPGLRGSALGLLGTSLGLQERATLKHHFRDYTHILMYKGCYDLVD